MRPHLVDFSCGRDLGDWAVELYQEECRLSTGSLGEGENLLWVSSAIISSRSLWLQALTASSWRGTPRGGPRRWFVGNGPGVRWTLGPSSSTHGREALRVLLQTVICDDG